MTLFSVYEARNFRHQGAKPLADATTFPNADIEAAAARIAEAFADICGVAFVPTTTTRVLDGEGFPVVLLLDPLVTSIDALESWDGTVWANSTATYRLLDNMVYFDEGGSGYWGYGWRGRASMRVTYTHGYETPPLEIVRAGLILAVNQLVGSNVSDRATQQTNEFGTYNLAVAGWRDGQPFGLPEVDAVLAREASRWRGPQVW